MVKAKYLKLLYIFAKKKDYMHLSMHFIFEIEISEAFPEAVFYDCASRERDLGLSLTNLAKQRC